MLFVAGSMFGLFALDRQVRASRRSVIEAELATKNTLRQLKHELDLLDDQDLLVDLPLPIDRLVFYWPRLDEDTLAFLPTPIDEERIYDGWGNPIILMHGRRPDEYWFVSRGRNGIDEAGKGDDLKEAFKIWK